MVADLVARLGAIYRAGAAWRRHRRRRRRSSGWQQDQQVGLSLSELAQTQPLD